MINEIWNQFATDYPDIAGPVTRVLQRRDHAHQARMNDAHTRLFTEALEVCYPDWEETRDSRAFREWMQAEPDRMLRAQVPGVKAALALFHEFDAAHGRGKRLRGGGDEYFADITDRMPPVRQPRGIDPNFGMASLSDILPAARRTVH